MNTSTVAQLQLVLDPETGVILKAPQNAQCSQNYASIHPNIVIEGARLFAGPDAERAAKAYRDGEESVGDFVVYEIQSTTDRVFNLRKLAHQ